MMYSSPTDLRVDHQREALGVAVRTPAFSWVLPPGMDVAGAYQIAVERLDASGAAVETVWDTGWCTTAEAPAGPWVTYAGTPLLSNTDYQWRVRVQGQRAGDDQAEAAELPGDATAAAGESEWARSRFSTSLFPEDIAATPWIQPAQEPITLEPPVTFENMFGPRGDVPPPAERLHPPVLVRQDLHLDVSRSRLLRARLYSTAHGVVEVAIDGTPVSDTVLAPGWTSYDQYTEFEVADVLALLAGAAEGDLAGAGEPIPAETAAADQAATASAHTLSLTLGDGWYGGRMTITGTSGQYGRLLSAWWQLHLTWEDGTEEVLTPDETARSTRNGPLRYSDILIGEARDDRRAADIAGWQEPGFDDTAWEGVTLLAPAEIETPTRLEPFRGEPVRRVMTLSAVDVITTPEGDTVLDFGQVIAGRVRIRAVGAAGTTITLDHSEHLDKDGNYFSNVQGPNKDQRDQWTLAGTGTPDDPEEYEPTFTFHGFRYARVTGYPGTLTPADADAIVIASDLEEAGTFECSNPDLNQLHSNVVWSQRGNFLSIPTDCPQRERVGWTGDIQIFAPAATNNARVGSFLARWMRNLRADQYPNGRVPIVVPWPPSMKEMESLGGLGAISSAAGWGDAVIRVPLAMWERCGDLEILADNYEAMRAWVGMQREQAATELPVRLRPDYNDLHSGWEALDEATAARQRLLWNSRLHFGDWLAPSTMVPGAYPDVDHPEAAGMGPIMVAPIVTSEIVGSAFYAESLRTMSTIAGVLGKDQDAAEYAQQWQAVRQAVAEEYVGADGRVEPDLQGMYVLLLAFDLVPADLRECVAARLVELVEAAGNHLDTGFLSIPFLLDVLEETGHRDVAWRLLLQDTIPSWLYEVKEGATTIWEAWAAVEPDGTVGAMSFNHYAFGAVDDWMFRRIGGIAPAAPGFAQVTVAPLVDGPVSWARTTRETPYGQVAVSWQREGEQVTYEVTLPGAVTGTLVAPDGTEIALAAGTTQHSAKL